MTSIKDAGIGIYYTLIYTPWWVYLIFFYLLFIGFKASKGGVVPVAKMLIMPIVFGAMSIDTLRSSFSMDAFVLGTYIIALLVGTGFGGLQAKWQKPEPDKDKKRLRMPGTWSTMILILIIFISKYYFGYEAAMDPQLLHNNGFEFAMLSVSGIVTGLFIGRAIYYYWKCYNGPWIDIDAENASKTTQ